MTAKDHHKSGSTSTLTQKFQEDDAAKMAELLEHPSYIELQQKLTEAEEKASQNWERILRMQADAENAHRRAQRDIESAHKYGTEKLVSELLPVIDNLERAVSLSEDQQNSVLEGVLLTLKMFSQVLEKFGVEQVDPIGKPFNPELHQAVSTQVDADVPANTVLNVLQKGYLLNNRLVRPALVVVSKTS